MTTVAVVRADIADDGVLRALWEVEQAAHRAARRHPLLRTHDAFVAQARRTDDPTRRVLLAARVGDEVVGAAELSLLGSDNLHLAELEVVVAPARQRTGVGRALWLAARDEAQADGRDTVVGEVYESPDGGGAALAFATAIGAVSVHQEEHLALDLDGADGADGVTGSSDDGGDGYTVVAWGDRCPDEHLTDYARLRTRMEHDVPQGELDRRPVEVTEERVRAREGRLSPSYHSLVAAVRHGASGELVGYTQLLVPHGETAVMQDDTLVEPEHRGHGLGARLKRANLARLRAEHPDATAVHTWTAPDNAPMLHTNLALGFVIVERMHEMQVRSI